MSAIKVNTITPLSGTHTSGSFNGVFSGSIVSDRIDKLETFSSSLDTAFATDEQLNVFTASQDSRNFILSEVTGSLIGITNGLMEFTSALDASYATNEQLYQLYQATASLQQFSSSIQSEVNDIKAWTASLELINTIDTELYQLYQTTASLNSKTGSYATTGSNVFSGTQTISDSLIVSEIVSTTAPAEGDIASAGETGITYLTGDLAKWAIFREDAFTIGVWTDVVAGWTVTDNDGFTDIIAGRGSFGAASFQTTTNNWPAPASGRTYVFTSPDYQPESANPLEIAVGNNDWVFGVGGDLDVPGNINGVPNLATTGSNEFVGNQTISGSFLVSGSTTQIGNNTLDGNTLLSGTIGIVGNSTLTGSFLVSGSTAQIGNNTLDGNTILSGSINISGSTSQIGNNTLIGNNTITGSNNLSGNNTIIGTNDIVGNTLMSGSLAISASADFNGDVNINGSFYVSGSKQFNRGQFYHTATLSGSADTAYPFQFNTTDTTVTNGTVYVDEDSKIYVKHTGVYNIQFSAQLRATTNDPIEFSVWFSMTGSNIMDSNTDFSIAKVGGGGNMVAALNYLMPIESGSYIELYYSKTRTDGEIQAKGVQTSPTRPATPSVILTVTQTA